MGPFYAGTPTPAARSEASSGPCTLQQSANFPSITTAGTVFMPDCFARAATPDLRISSTSTSHEEQAMRFTSSIVVFAHWTAGTEYFDFSLHGILFSLFKSESDDSCWSRQRQFCPGDLSRIPFALHLFFWVITLTTQTFPLSVSCAMRNNP